MQPYISQENEQHAVEYESLLLVQSKKSTEAYGLIRRSTSLKAQLH
jgi:hypothetical protein